MDSQNTEENYQIRLLDEAFKSYIDDMKPFVLSLSDRKDRQRIALWIKKLCGPISLNPLERKNRNLHAQILFQMLRRGSLTEPFNEEPANGPLQVLPAYLSKHLDDMKSASKAKFREKEEKAPDWIRGELPSTDSAFSELREQKSVLDSGGPDSSVSPSFPKISAASKYFGIHRLPDLEYTTISEESQMDKADSSHEADSLDGTSDEETNHHIQKKGKRLTPPSSTVRGKSENIQWDCIKKYTTNDVADLHEDAGGFRTRLTSKSPELDFHSSPSEEEDLRATIKELEGKISSLEAMFTKEKFMLHQEKDQAVQKVLGRKNSEIEDIRSQFRNKINDAEEGRRRQEKKIAKLTRDLTSAISRNDNEVQELQAIIKQNRINAEHELERRVHEKVSEFEQEKFAMQKEHSQHIQELLDETNERLKKIENEYAQKIESSENHVRDLEHEIYQLKRSRDLYKQEKDELIVEKGELKNRLSEVHKEHKHLESRIKEIEKEKSEMLENHDKQFRELRWKTDSTLEIMKKENSNAKSKASSVVSELEGKVNQYKQSIQDLELQRKRDLREQESNHRQEVVRLEVNHEKKIKLLKMDFEKMETELQNKLKIAEQTIKEKEEKLAKVAAELSDQHRQAQAAIENFKLQAEETSKKTFQEMKQQISKVEGDLANAYRENSDQKAKHVEEMKLHVKKYEKQIADLKILRAQEKDTMIKDRELDLENQSREFNEALEDVKSKLTARAVEAEDRLRIERESNLKKLQDNEQTIRELRDEVIQANSLRKQQLVELGMLREEEKKNFKRKEESMHTMFKSELEQQRLDLQKDHASAMEALIEKTNAKVKEIEQDYSLSLEKSQQTVTELQSHVMEINEKLSREQSQAQARILDLTEKHEKDKEDLRRNHITTITALHHDIELYRAKSKDLERNCSNLEIQSQENLTKQKLEYEERLRGLLPNSARMELEDTITALREQITLIQSRASLLQQELDSREGLSTSFSEHGPQLTSSR